ncbi:MAG: ATPase [Candidatus Portnoybacteria bacterium CG10_big_fil_rev_8_21_14_0_10_38_18]|uniref:ATPase n=1 Tax=Candidatus Portnoybacteria bacterium CG10_big_fil_rev_8_21_14_0_10_38_18 TaxID=1974813 RepID=A0A2M8KCV8_9BACT|nr:MAG: ATPase [Candidatus Portnoybacteria bacterium CG10_big_fil_rev_8_21_14_0_10_38_18]
MLKLEKQNWHSIRVESVLRHLKSNKNGLSEKEVQERFHRFGFNKLPEEKPVSKIKVFLEQFKSPLIYILLIAGIITLVLRDWTDSVVIFAAVFLNAFIGYFQENKTSQILAKLKKVIREKAIVIREKQEKEITQTHLVVGDIIILKPGDKVPADARLIENLSLKINESALTGEWLAVDKSLDVLPEGVPLAERKNMLYMGTVVESGRGKAAVVAIGVHTEIGKIAVSIKTIEEEQTPYQVKMAYFSKVIALIVGAICLIIFVFGALSGRNLLEMFVTSVAVAVAAIPEGLPVAITVILALGMERILKQKGLVRRLVAAEVLGSTSIICTDKTGTLTQAKMQVADIFADTKEFPRELVLKIGIRCSEAFVENIKEPMSKWIIRGSPTEKAIVLAGLESGLKREELDKEETKIDMLSFDPVYKYSASLHKFGKTQDMIYIMGAPEILLQKAKYFKTEKEEENLTKNKLDELTKKYEKLDNEGLRLVAVAYKKIPKDSLSSELNKQLELGQLSETTKQNIYENYLKDIVFVAFIAIKDPLREEAKEAIKICQQAGMRPIIITGDHPFTAKAIAKELGIPAESENIIKGDEFEKLSEEEFKKRLKDISIYARMEPRQKLRIIEAWQARGEIVAMTGDGINDAPALKKANIGVALGSGTDVAKEASDLVLLTDNFSIIVTAVKEGRTIINNIRKVITFLFADGFTEIILIGTSVLAGFPLPVLPAQILWVNLLEDGFPAISLGFEKEGKDVMQRKPENPKAHLLTREMRILIFVIGIITDLILLGLFIWLLKTDLSIAEIRTIMFAALTIDSIFYVFSCKNLKKNIWHINIFSNPFLILSWFFAVIMLVLAIYVPFLQTLLKTVRLNFHDWIFVFGIGFINLFLIELTKIFFRKES